MTCSSRLPRMRRALASWISAWSSRNSSPSAATDRSRSSGSASTAATITRAWSGRTSPAARAARTGSWPPSWPPSCAPSWVVPRAVARLILRCASARVWRVWVAHQAAVEVAPESSPTWVVSAWAATRSSSSAIRAPRRVRATRVVRVSSWLIDQAGWSVSSSRRSWSSAAATAIGCPDAVVVVRLLMGPLKHRPPTFRPRFRGSPQPAQVTSWVTTFAVNGGGFVARCARTSSEQQRARNERGAWASAGRASPAAELARSRRARRGPVTPLGTAITKVVSWLVANAPRTSTTAVGPRWLRCEGRQA